MKQDKNLIKLFNEMMISEKMSSVNTRRAYISDVQLFVNFINKRYNLSVLSLSKEHISGWLDDINNKNISRNTTLRKLSSIKEFFKFLVIDGFKASVSSNLVFLKLTL